MTFQNETQGVAPKSAAARSSERSRPDTLATFLKVILPLSVTGIFAGFVLTFVTNVGDYVNQQVLGGTGTYTGLGRRARGTPTRLRSVG